MSLANYADLQTAVANWLNRADLTAYIPDLITLAESRIYKDLRVSAMEANLSATISGGVIAIPAGYLEMKYAYVNSSTAAPLIRKTAAWIYEYYQTRAADREPQFYASDQGNFIFGPYPDSTYTINGTYYQKLPALSTSSTNWFMTNHPGLFLFGTLLEAEPFLKNDNRLAIWQAKYNEIRDAIALTEKRERFSGSSLSITPSNY